MPGERSAFILNVVEASFVLRWAWLWVKSDVTFYIIVSFQNWKKFGNSEFDAPGPNVATTTVSDDVFMTFISSKEVSIFYELYIFVLFLTDAFQTTLCLNYGSGHLLGLVYDTVLHFISRRTWTHKTRMRILWTNWKDRRLCLVVFAKVTIGPPAVHTRTHWAPCRRSSLNSLGFPLETRRNPLALVPSAYHSHHQILICFRGLLLHLVVGCS